VVVSLGEACSTLAVVVYALDSNILFLIGLEVPLDLWLWQV